MALELLNKQFGFLTVVERIKNNNTKSQQSLWKCKCICGKLITLQGRHIPNRKNMHCGCLKELSGKKFGKLIVKNKSKICKKDRLIYWDCICDCGKETSVPGSFLTRGIYSSCGCKNGIKWEGRTFTFLTVVEKMKNVHPTKLLCKCICNNETIVEASNLVKGAIISCGCSIKRKDRNYCTWKRIYSYLKHSKDKRSRIVDFNLTLNEVQQLCSQSCHYCNESYSLIKKDIYFNENGIEIKYNGLDRIDSNKGYTSDNVVPCCTRCNMAKNDMTMDEFKCWLNKIFSHFILHSLENK